MALGELRRSAGPVREQHRLPVVYRARHVRLVQRLRELPHRERVGAVERRVRRVDVALASRELRVAQSSVASAASDRSSYATYQTRREGTSLVAEPSQSALVGRGAQRFDR